MVGGHIRNLLRSLLRVAPPAEGPALSDGQLLERFAAARDEDAFELLARRHGAMVLGVCRRVLGDAHEAEDALQATFLILAKKAGAIPRDRSVGGWLYTVAYRVALRVRARRAARAGREHPLVEPPPASDPDPASATAWREVREVIDEEVSRLPEKYRVPFVLFHLEGRSTAEVARELGCLVGTVECWLTRARQRLRARLARRHLTPTLGLLVALAPQEGWAARASAAARAALATASPGAVALAGEVIRASGAARARVALLALLLAAAVAGAAGLVLRAPASRPPPSPPPEAIARDKERPDENARAVGWVTLRHFKNAHQISVNAIALSPDGKTLVSGGDDGRVKLWDRDTRKLRANLAQYWDLKKQPGLQQAHTGRVYALAFSPDGKTLATGGSDRTVKLWEVRTGLERALGPCRGFVSAVAFSSDGRHLAAGAGAPPLATDLAPLVWRFEDRGPKAPPGIRVYSPDDTGGQVTSRVLDLKGTDIYTEYGEVRVWDLADGRARSFYYRGTGRITSVAFSPDCKTLAAGGRDGAVRLWEVRTGKSGPTFWHRNYCITGLAFSPDGKTLSLTTCWDASPTAPPPGEGDSQVILREFPSGRVRARLRGHPGWVTAQAFTPDGKILATAGDPPPPRFRPWAKVTGEVRLWDVATRRPLGAPLTFGHRAASVAFDPSGEILAVGGPGASAVYSGAPGEMTLVKLTPRPGKAP